MNKLSKKSLLLFISALAMAAFAMPSMAAAATFDGDGTHTQTSSNLSFTSAALGAGSTCTSSIFDLDVSSTTASATVTGAAFSGCSGTGALAGVPVDVTATGFPWEITRTGVGTFDIEGIHVTVNFTGVTHVTLHGSLEGSINNTTHTVTFANSPGLTAISPLGNGTATVTGDFRDDQNSLAVT